MAEKNVNTAKSSRNPTVQNLSRSLDQTVRVMNDLQRGLRRAQSANEARQIRRMLRTVNDVRRSLNQIEEYADRIRNVATVMSCVSRLRRIDVVAHPEQAEQAARQFDRLFATLGSMMTDLPPPFSVYGHLLENFGSFFQDNLRNLHHQLLDPQMRAALEEQRGTQRRGVMQPGERR